MSERQPKKIQVVEYPLSTNEKKIITANKIILPAFDEGSDKPHLSCTQITMYLRCPKQYEYRYVLGEKDPPSVAMTEGTSHHTVNESNNIHKIKTGRDKTSKQQASMFGDVFSTDSKTISDWEGETKDSVIKRGKSLQTYYINKVANRIMPEFVEDYIEINLGGIKIIGYMDVAGTLTNMVRKNDKDKIALDYKVAGKLKTEDQVESDLQLSLYGWQYSVKKNIDSEKVKVGFCTFRKSTNPTVEIQATNFKKARIRWFRVMALHVANSVSLGSFPPCDSSNNFLCQPKYCGYYKKCKGKVFRG